MYIVLSGIKGESSIAELCRTHGISQVQYYSWRDLFLKGAQRALSGKQHTNGADAAQARIKELERIIGKQTVTIEILNSCMAEDSSQQDSSFTFKR